MQPDILVKEEFKTPTDDNVKEEYVVDNSNNYKPSNDINNNATVTPKPVTDKIVNNLAQGANTASVNQQSVMTQSQTIQAQNLSGTNRILPNQNVVNNYPPKPNYVPNQNISGVNQTPGNQINNQ